MIVNVDVNIDNTETNDYVGIPECKEEVVCMIGDTMSHGCGGVALAFGENISLGDNAFDLMEGRQV